jgi:tetratricopeptide (TPR) repeat protein
LEVRWIAFALGVGTIASLVLMAEMSQASIYTPDDPKIALPTGADGKVQPLELIQLLARLSSFSNALDKTKKDGKINADRQQLLDHIEKLKAIRSPSVDEKVALAGYLMKVGEIDSAIAILNPLTHDRRPSYFVYQNLSQLYAMSGDWKEALHYYQEGILDTEMPQTVKGLTAPQREFWKQLDDEYLPRFYHFRLEDSDRRKGLKQAAIEKLNEKDEVLPLFPLPKSKIPPSPVRFVNDGGSYQPGHLAVAEQAKLPPDAIAIVQQLLLWFPNEPRLYWLLAELYAAANNLRASATLFEKCAWSLQFGNRKVMMEHRAAVMSAVPKDAPPTDVALTQDPTASPPPEPQPKSVPAINMTVIWFYFGIIGLIAVFAIVRAISRRSKGSFDRAA